MGYSKKKGGRFTDSKKEGRGVALPKNLSQSRTVGDESEGVFLN